MRSSIVSIMLVLILLLSLPASSALVNRYSFIPEPNDPNVIDSIGGKNGTSIGAAAQIDGQLVLDGADSWVSLPGDILSDYTSVSVEAWFTLDAASGWVRVFDFGDTSNLDGGYYWFYTPSGNGSRLVISTGGFPGWQAGEEAATAAALAVATPYHLVCVYDEAATEMRIYQNGVQVGSNSAVTMLLSDVHRAFAYIGKAVYPNDPELDGSISEFRIYNTPLYMPAVILNEQLGPDLYKECGVTSLSPAHQATNIPVNAPLNWTANPSIDTPTFEVFVVTDPNLLDPNTVPVPSSPVYSGTNISFTTGTLANSTVYYWRVDTIDSTLTRYPGPRYQFTTVPPTPVFTVNPGNSGAFPAETAVLTATCSSATGLTQAIKWFKEAGTTDVEITTSDPDVSIAETIDGQLTTSTLTINNVTLARDGQYYAKATNAGGSVDSSYGWIVIKRLYAQYQFEGNLNDSSPSGLNGSALTPSGAASTVAYAASVNAGMGQALSMTGTGTSNITNTTDPYVDLPNGFANFSQGITISAWVYPTSTVAWQRICQIGNGTGGANNSFYFTRNGTSTQIRFENDNTNPSSATQITGANNTIVVNTWQHLVIAINTNATNNAVIYRNGIAVQTGTITLPNVVTRTNCFIGRSEWYGDYLFRGQMDDVRFYNYGLGADDVAQLYSDVMGAFCQYKPTYDLTGNDCKVNLDDILIFAAQWLDCGIYPASECD